MTAMASIRKIGNGWRAEVCVNGKRRAKTFVRKTDASLWATTQTLELKNGESTDHTLKDALQRYALEESPVRKGARWEVIRLSAFETVQHNLPLNTKLRDLTPDDFARWRDYRLQTVKPGTVIRDMTLMGSVLETARRRWRWIEKNPIRDTRKPAQPKHRDVTITTDQIRVMLKTARYSINKPKVSFATQRVMLAFLTALRTGMRAGEICALTWPDIHIKDGRGFARLKTSKTGKGRDVPLTAKATRYLFALKNHGTDSVFDLESKILDTMFRKIRAKAKLSGFTFHDSRHTAATWIAGRLKSAGNIPAQQALLDLCKIFGWTKIDRALTYYNPDPNDILDRLA